VDTFSKILVDPNPDPVLDRIRSVLRGRIRIRSKPDRIPNTASQVQLFLPSTAVPHSCSQGCGTGKFEDDTGSGSDILSEYGSGSGSGSCTYIYIYEYIYIYVYIFANVYVYTYPVLKHILIQYST
jgi:hypothetical protein